MQFTLHDRTGDEISNPTPDRALGDTAHFANAVTPSSFYGNYKMPFRMTVSCLNRTPTGCSPVDK